MKKNIKNIFIYFAFCLVVWFLFPALSWAQGKTITNHLGMEFVRVNPGSFMMGSPKNELHRGQKETLHEMTISKPFYLQSTEVTIQQWEAIVGKRLFSRKKGLKNSPVTRISFFDCLKFIKKLNKLKKGVYRLPSEAEWEYACRAGTKTAYSWGNTIDCSKAMFANNSKKEPGCIPYFTSQGLLPNQAAPVKSFAPNPWGFYDMHGNVWEWCKDPFQDYQNPTAEKGYHPLLTDIRVKRGGSWYRYGWSCRSANRAFAHPGARLQTTGFRLVLEAEE